MKFTKKIFTMLMAVVMMMAMATTAWAADTATVTIQVIEDEQVVASTSLTPEITAGLTLQQVLDDNKATLNPQWKEVTNWNDPAVPAYALEALTVNGEEYATEAGTTDDLVGTKFAGATAVAGHPGYFQMNDAAEGQYHYVYAGWDWTYGYANSTTPIYDYMSQFVMEAGQQLVLTYSLNISDWTTTTPIQ